MHLERSAIYEESGTNELVVEVIAENVTDILAQIALDALAELLHPLDVALCHAPGAVSGIGGTRREGLNPLLDLVVPGNVGDQVPDNRERAHRFDGDRLI